MLVAEKFCILEIFSGQKFVEMVGGREGLEGRAHKFHILSRILLNKLNKKINKKFI